MKSRLLLGSVAAVALCAPAQAAGMSGWYFSLEGGANWVKDLSFDEQATSLGVVTHIHPVTNGGETGWAALASVGYGLGNRWRIEVEGGYRHNEMPDLTSFYQNATTTNATFVTNSSASELREFTIMANVMYDVPLTERMSLTLGAGAGGDYAQYEASGFGEDETWNFAYQGVVGLNYAMGRQSQLYLRYRYLGVPDPEFTLDTDGSHTSAYNFDDIGKHTATLGFRYFFAGAAEPPPPPPPPAASPPPPPPAAPKQFIIFFGFNKCDITAEADKVLGDAASAAKSTGAAAVKVVGHTDSSGSPNYNQRLSECRSGAAKSNLVGKGIPDGAISTSGRGEGDLMVQTGDGVKEPQNRRATIDLE